VKIILEEFEMYEEYTLEAWRYLVVFGIIIALLIAHFVWTYQILNLTLLVIACLAVLAAYWIGARSQQRQKD